MEVQKKKKEEKVEIDKHGMDREMDRWMDR